MRTPDEIKRGLECCLTNEGCWHCPYDDPATKDCAICMPELLADSLAYNRQLEADNAQQARCIENMTDKLNAANDVMAELKAERDALMHWAKGRCDTCAHNDDCVKHDPDPEGYIMH